MKEKKKFQETKVGKFLKSKGFDKALEIAEAAGVPGAGILDGIKDMVLGDNPERPLSPEEKEQFTALYQQQIAEYDLMLKDVQNARGRDISINEADNSSWLSRNITSIIAVSFVALYITSLLIILIGKVKTNDGNLSMIITSLQNIVMLIVGFYFGTSMRSGMKDGTIKTLLQRQ